jgi:hypothetical protein
LHDQRLSRSPATPPGCISRFLESRFPCNSTLRSSCRVRTGALPLSPDLDSPPDRSVTPAWTRSSCPASERCFSTNPGLRHEAPSNRAGCDARPRPPQWSGEAGGQQRRRRCGVGRQAALDNRAAVRRQRAGCGSKAERRRETEPVVEAPRLVTGPETGGCGPLGRSVLVLGEGRLFRSLLARAVEAACRVAVTRGDAPGVQLGADPADRLMSERGKRPGGARRTFGFGAGAPSAVAAGARRGLGRTTPRRPTRHW